jgi:hypothetical protein
MHLVCGASSEARHGAGVRSGTTLHNGRPKSDKWQFLNQILLLTLLVLRAVFAEVRSSIVLEARNRTFTVVACCVYSGSMRWQVDCYGRLGPRCSFCFQFWRFVRNARSKAVRVIFFVPSLLYIPHRTKHLVS